MVRSIFTSCSYRPVWPYLAGIAAFAVSVLLGRAGATVDQLGLSGASVILLLLATVACRSLTLQVYTMRGGRQKLKRFPEVVRRAVLRLRDPFVDDTVVALNVGGVLIPLAFSLYELSQSAFGSAQSLITSIYLVAVSQLLRPSPTGGVSALFFVIIAPAMALLLGWTLGEGHRAAFAYVSGFIGILIGDLLDLRHVSHIGVPAVVIGSNETFDSIFLNQLFSLLLC